MVKGPTPTSRKTFFYTFFLKNEFYKNSLRFSQKKLHRAADHEQIRHDQHRSYLYVVIFLSPFQPEVFLTFALNEKAKVQMFSGSSTG